MKVNMSKITFPLFGILFLLFVFQACQKSVSTENQPSRMNIYLTDAPANYKAVLIDVQSVLIKSEDDTSSQGWVTVPLAHPGVYNLLDLRNGNDTLLGGVDLPSGKVTQLRLVLGTNNSITLEDGTVVPLKTPSAQQSGLKIKVDANVAPGIPYDLVIDFDASRSIVKAGNSGQYILKPVLRAYTKASGGGIQGVVLPDSAHAQVMAISTTDTLGALPDTTGFYKFTGIPAGSYTLIFQADSATSYHSDTIPNISVTSGNVTTVDTVRLVH